jgi:Cytochrome c oxidase subunit IV
VNEDQGQRNQAAQNLGASDKAMKQALKAKQSYWPFALAASLSIALFGVIVHPIVFWVGVVLVVVSMIAWGLERH